MKTMSAAWRWWSAMWIKLAAHIAGLLSNTHTQYFDTAEEAQVWLERPVAAGT